jgi:hypothetical protein
MERDHHPTPARTRVPAGLVRVLAVALATALLVGLGVGPGAAPSAVHAMGPLPECRLADIPTVPNDYDSWSTTLVDWLLTVGKDYVPPDLVSVL